MRISLPQHKRFLHRNIEELRLGSHPKFLECLENIWKWHVGGKDNPPPSYPKYIIAVRPDHFDARIVSQRSYFTFHVPDHPELKVDHNKTLTKVIIDKDAKGEIRKELFRLGVDEFSIYRDLDHLSQRLKFAYELSRHLPR